MNEDMNEYIELIIPNKESIEYFCNDCKQLRFSYNNTERCKNCRSFDIVKAKPGMLNKKELLDKE